jgi:hypothetical protein
VKSLVANEKLMGNKEGEEKNAGQKIYKFRNARKKNP